MGSLANPVKTETYILLIAGLVMVITLWTSKKAHRVVKTSVDLSRQGEGDERFGSSFFARSLVRGSIALSNSVSSVIPAPIKNYLSKQFEMRSEERRVGKEGRCRRAW